MRLDAEAYHHLGMRWQGYCRNVRILGPVSLSRECLWLLIISDTRLPQVGNSKYSLCTGRYLGPAACWRPGPHVR